MGRERFTLIHREAGAMLAERAARLDDIERYGCAVAAQ